MSAFSRCLFFLSISMSTVSFGKVCVLEFSRLNDNNGATYSCDGSNPKHVDLSGAKLASQLLSISISKVIGDEAVRLQGCSNTAAISSGSLVNPKSVGVIQFLCTFDDH